MTNSLYDCYLNMSCTAEVLTCVPINDNSYGVTFDKTVFFSGGGGQDPDTGSVNGNPILSVKRQNGTIVHILSEKLSVGQKCDLLIDSRQRLDDSEHHTGEHILSGLAGKLFGVKNVGFHMGTDFCTADFDRILSEKELAILEKAVNTEIRANHPIRITYPDQKELESMPLRKRPQTDEPLRVVEIETVDLCACCGTHTLFTGQVGTFIIVDVSKIRGGSRIAFLCGRKAIDYVQNSRKILHDLSVSLSCRPEHLPERVSVKDAQITELKTKITLAQKNISSLLAEKIWNSSHEENGEKAIETEVESTELFSSLADELASRGPCHGLITCGNHYLLFALGGSSFDLQKKQNHLKEVRGARGGGKDGMILGIFSSQTIK